MVPTKRQCTWHLLNSKISFLNKNGLGQFYQQANDKENTKISKIRRLSIASHKSVFPKNLLTLTRELLPLDSSASPMKQGDITARCNGWIDHKVRSNRVAPKIQALISFTKGYSVGEVSSYSIQALSRPNWPQNRSLPRVVSDREQVKGIAVRYSSAPLPCHEERSRLFTLHPVSYVYLASTKSERGKTEVRESRPHAANCRCCRSLRPRNSMIMAFRQISAITMIRGSFLPCFFWVRG